MNIQIRTATLHDVQAITHIYNDAVLHTTATFDTEAKTVDNRMEWFAQHGPQYPVWVATAGDEVVGWASLSRWSDRAAYNTTCEESVYVAKEFRNNGIGKMLLKAITEQGGTIGKVNIIARITTDNLSSIHIHKQCGYIEVGVLHKVGIKFGRFLDVMMMEKVF